MTSLRTDVLVRLGAACNRTFVLPLVIFYPTSRCNSRCASCDWWRHDGSSDLTLDEIERLARALPALGTAMVVFSGGEPLLRPDVFEAASLFRRQGLTLQLLTSGVLLERRADDVAREFSRVCISLDATTEDLYQRVRGIAALGIVSRGVARLRQVAPGLPLTARATLHRANFRELPHLIRHAQALGLDGISFLAADVSSRAFGRDARVDLSSLVLDHDEVSEFETVVEEAVASCREAFATGFVAESPDKLRRLPRYYAALAGEGPFPAVRCDAPWVSVVVEANGDVRPCFFHEPVGTVRRTPLDRIVSAPLCAFRSTLDVSRDPVCRRCVCSLKTGWRHAPWHQ